MKCKIVVSFIIIMMIICNFQYSQATTQTTYIKNYYKDEQLGMLAYKQVDAFRLSLADGSTLADVSVNSSSGINAADNWKDAEIVFVLDVSGSMGGTRETTTRVATQDLVEKLFTRLGSNHIKIGGICFDNGIHGDVLEPLSNQKDVINQWIEDNVGAWGGTEILTALQKAHSMLTSSGEDNEDKIKMVCTLSDGAIWDETEAIEELKKMNEDGISTLSIFVETDVTQPFSNLADESSGKHRNFHTTTANLANTISKDILRAIYWGIISAAQPTITYDMTNVGMYPNDDKFVIQADEELLHGATLEIEYIFVFITTFDCNHIKIFDYYNKNLVFSQGQKLLTEDATNGEFGWNIEEGILVNDSGDTIHDDLSERYVKLVLSTVLTPTVVSGEEFGEIGNYMNFSLNYNMDEGEENTITLVVGQSNTGWGEEEEEKIKANSVLIIPPTGLIYISSKDFVLILNTIVVSVSVLLMFVCTKDYIKSKKGKLKK